MDKKELEEKMFTRLKNIVDCVMANSSVIKMDGFKAQQYEPKTITTVRFDLMGLRVDGCGYNPSGEITEWSAVINPMGNLTLEGDVDFDDVINGIDTVSPNIVKYTNNAKSVNDVMVLGYGQPVFKKRATLKKEYKGAMFGCEGSEQSRMVASYEAIENGDTIIDDYAD